MIKKIAAAVLLLAVILSAGCVAEKTAETGDTVSVYYTLYLDDGRMWESNVGKTPLSFVIGDGKMVSGFDAAVTGMKVGETKTVRLSPAEAYGEITESMIQEMSVAELIEKIGSLPAEGEVLSATVQTEAGYQYAFLKVMSIDNREGIVYLALMRAPLVGEYLTFTITLDAIQEQGQKELIS
ncbi:MAG: FKBP-type peptidyl-prolyl cis-trans isomerase [Methanocorpusculum sp.]|nr:FKBP-type peptidyl-prolyl cis-trans isomerase [Methanocorpusculum sp.]